MPETNRRMPKKRFFTDSCGKSSLGARLRTRKVRGRDASLPAPLLSAFEMLVARGTVGALPQTPQGTLSLDPARGRRKGTKSPLDPFSRLSWSRFHAPSACSFFGASPKPLFASPIFREEPQETFADSGLYRARERSHSTCFCSPARRGVPGKAIPVWRSFSSEYARWHKCPLNWGCASR